MFVAGFEGGCVFKRNTNDQRRSLVWGYSAGPAPSLLWHFLPNKSYSKEWTFICVSFRHIWNYLNECNCKVNLFHCFIAVSMLCQRQDRAALEGQEAAERVIFCQVFSTFLHQRTHITSANTPSHRTTTRQRTPNLRHWHLVSAPDEVLTVADLWDKTIVLEVISYTLLPHNNGLLTTRLIKN